MWNFRHGPWLALVMLAVCLFPSTLAAQSVRLAWDGSPDAAGYLVKWGTSPGTYSESKDAAGTTSIEIGELTAGASYWAVVQAYNADGEFSAPSDPLPFVAPPAECTFRLNPSGISIGAGAASGTLYVTTEPGCAWSALSASGFIVFDNGLDRVGPDTVTFHVAANALGSPRHGTAIVGGQTFDVTQEGLPPCVYGITPAAVSLGHVGDSGTIFVSSPEGCPWSAVSESSFIDFTDGTGRSGSGALSFSVQSNFSSNSRTGSASIAGQTFSVTQTAGPVDASTSRDSARADFDGDGKADLLWQDVQGGELALWSLDGHHIITSQSLPYQVQDNEWRIVGTGDFNGDSKPDIVWQHKTEGWVYLWYMDGLTRIGDTYFSMFRMPSAGWRIVGIADFNGDSKPDIVWQHPTERWVSVWLIDGLSVTNVALSPGRILDSRWQIAGTGDFNGDGHTDLLWRDRQSGELGTWLMSGLTRLEYVPLAPGRVLDGEWEIAAVIDANGDSTPDIVWQHATHGWAAIWYMNGVARTDVQSFAVTLPLHWKIAGPK